MNRLPQMIEPAYPPPPEPGTGRVLVVDDHDQVRRSMADILGHAGHRVDQCSSAAEALRTVDGQEYDVIISDLKMPGMNGLEFVETLHHRGNEARVVMVTAHATVSTAVQAMRFGAFDYIEKPFGVDQLEQLVARALQSAARPHAGATIPPAGTSGSDARMVGTSEAMQTLRQCIARAAPTGETILITGESGTGKELVARSVHAVSRRADRPMIGLNCPALSPQLMESELFGHERGAFTSADAARVGRFELADGGTILLDEVTEIEMPLQAKLLRVLQEHSFERVGSSCTQRVDVRVLATTNRDLRRQVEERRFREDLYFRLAVVPLHVPPLRDRLDDVHELTAHFLAQAADRLHRDPCRLDAPARDLLANYHWPGNVRELENIITRASVLQTGSTVRADDLRPWLIDPQGGAPPAATAKITVGLNLQEMERQLIEATLEHFDGHRAKTAEALGIGARTLCNKLRSYGYAPRAKTLDKAA